MNDSPQPTYVFDGFRLDAQHRVLTGADGYPLPLTPKALDTLLYLVERSGQMVDKRELLDAVWPHVVVEENNLNQAVSALRRTLGETPGEHRFIVTEPGRGYRFVASVATAARHGADDDERLPPDMTHEPPFDTASSAPAGVATATVPRRHYWVATLFGAMAFAVAAGLFGIRGRDPTPAVRISPLSFEKGGQRTPVWSPDGSAIAFAARASTAERYQVYVRELDSPVARPITRTAMNPFVRQWTAAGRIVFVDDTPEPGLSSVSPAGGAPELLVALDRSIVCCRQGLDVMRDGSTFVATLREEDGTYGIWTAGLEDAAPHRYDPAPFAVRQLVNTPFARFSPDGRQLLLMWNPTEGEQAWLMPYPANASQPPQRILDGLPSAGGTPQFSWLPDNRHIVVSTLADTSTRSELYVADTQSGRFRTFWSGETNAANPVVSPDGDKLVFSEIRADYDVVTVALETAAVAPTIATGMSELMPAWAAHAPSLVYVTNRNGAPEIWLHEPGRLDRPLITGHDFATPTQWFLAPALSPDGARVIYQRVELENTTGGASSNLWISAVAGSSPERVTSRGQREQTGSWSPDGEWYVYTTLELDGSSTLKKVRTTGQAKPETLLVNVEELAWLPVWSPLGDWILIANHGMKLVSAHGKQVREIPIENAGCAFARDEALLYCIRAPQPDGRRPFVAIDFDGRIVSEIGSLAPEHAPRSSLGPGLRLTLTPDGAGLSYGVANVAENLWLMEGLASVDLP